MTSQPSQKELAYDRISDTWESFISHYDTNRRIEVLVADFLGEQEISGKECLDSGCGLGYFTQAILRYKPGKLYANDLAPKLVVKLSEKFPQVQCFVANILELTQALKGKVFNVVVCSDVIEHTAHPAQAIKNLTAVVAPGGLLSISVPNQRWKWLLRLAQILRIRGNYEGYENWVTPQELRAWIAAQGFEILRAEGIHTIPFKFFPKRLLRRLDQKLRHSNYHYALNLAILARKRS